MKRKLIAIFSVIIIIISPLLSSTQAMASESKSMGKNSWPKGPSVSADSAIVMEASTGLILYQKNMNRQHFPASITKIMTVLLALENSSLGDIVTFSKKSVYDVEADSSRLWVAEGEQMTMQQCLYAILLESCNDVAYGVAEHISGNITNFAKLMNEKAKSLGCKNTHFVNPHGLQNDNHYTSAYDMALITREAMKNDTFRKIFGTYTYQIPPTNLQSQSRYLHNHHKLISNQGFSYDGVIGGKTGYTSTSKYTLVTVAKRGDLELICVIMKDDSITHEYTDTEKLFDYGFNNFSIYPISDTASTKALKESPMFTKYNSLLSKADSPITTDKNGYVVLPNNASIKDAKKEVSFDTSNSNNNSVLSSSGSDSAGKIIGKISYTYDNKYVGGANILYKNTNTPTLIPSVTSSKNPVAAMKASSSKSNSGLRPIIIGIILGLIFICGGIYFITIERPRLKRRSTYYRKRKIRRRFYKNNDFLDF